MKLEVFFTSTISPQKRCQMHCVVPAVMLLGLVARSYIRDMVFLKSGSVWCRGTCGRSEGIVVNLKLIN